MSTLADVFRRGFGYDVNCYRIPNHNPYEAFEQTLYHFKHSRLLPNGLVIVYFSSHGNFDDRVRLRAYPRL
jgi:hypothetical protein